MTFSYSPGSPDDTTRVRFHVGDTVEDSAVLSDEEIGFAISEAGDWKPAVLWCIDYLIQKMAQDDGVTLDWLEMDKADGMKYLAQLKKSKRAQLGLSGAASGAVSGSVTHTRRFDSAADVYDADDVG